MKDPKSPPETPPLTRSGRKIAEATIEAAQFKVSSDGKSAVRQFEVHGMAVTEMVRARDARTPSDSTTKLDTTSVDLRHTQSRKPVQETAPLSRHGRRVADATLAASTFMPTEDGKRLVRQFEVHGMAVTEFVSTDSPKNGGKG